MMTALLWAICLCLLLSVAAKNPLARSTGFIYTYDLPTKFNTDIPGLPMEDEPWVAWYDADKAFHPFLKSHSTDNPEAADLFFIPVYSAQMYHNLLLNARLSHADATNGSASLVQEALQYVKAKYPYFERSNGMDHFMVAPLDYGRCHSLGGIPQEEQGDMFMIQPTGDLIQKDFETHTWHCYKPGRDVIIPVYMDSVFGQAEIVLPNSTERNISVLYRFLPGGRGNYAWLRTKLLDHQGSHPIPGSEAGWETISKTHEDMKHSIFCVCPPGIAQQTLRVSRSIMSGCIPVTLFKSMDSPFERNLRLDYTRFTVNINQEESHLLRPILMGLLARPHLIAELQSELAKVQQMFIWNEGVFEAVLTELARHNGRFATSH